MRDMIYQYIHTLKSSSDCKYVTIPMSLSTLSRYLYKDRSAMERCFKELEDMGLIERDICNIKIID